jgi:hypothetical protein
VEIAGVLRSGFILMGRVSLEIELGGVHSSRRINEFMDSLKGQRVLVKVEGS